MFSYKYEISIVMGYYNRKKQIINTLNMFEKSYKNYNYEVIIVDDNSSTEHKLKDIIQNYTFDIKYIEITEEEKGSRINPCIVYNKGFEKSEGRILIIQNPECYHVGDLINYIKNNLNENEYLSFSCYNTNNANISDKLINNLSLINNVEFTNYNSSLGGVWYNHPTFRPVNYHFCAAIYNDKIKLLGGFNKEFANGHSYDDNEILLSIKKNLNLNIKCIHPNNGFVIHQWHSRDSESKLNNIQINHLLLKNKLLYETYLNNHNKYTFNYPKLLHLYWDLSNFSYLNLMTVLSFNKYHFGWKINIFCPLNPIKNKSWNTDEQKRDYIGTNYFSELLKISNVNIHMKEITQKLNTRTRHEYKFTPNKL
jgi:hypothetical protein